MSAGCAWKGKLLDEANQQAAVRPGAQPDGRVLGARGRVRRHQRGQAHTEQVARWTTIQARRGAL
eukprot:5342923-Pyramimonas_sp.AAC.1